MRCRLGSSSLACQRHAVADRNERRIDTLIVANLGVECAQGHSRDAGVAGIGDRAVLVIVDPAHLDDSLDSFTEEMVVQYGGMSRMVNRNDDTVSAVLVAGQAVFLNGQPTEVLGNQRTGSPMLLATKPAKMSPKLPVGTVNVTARAGAPSATAEVK